jgi:hypothetical protein
MGWPTRLARMAGFAAVTIVALARVAAAQDNSRAMSTARASDIIAQSLALETRGDLARARQIVVDAFGERPDSYEPCVRLAALSLQMRHSADAVVLYRLARGLPDSQAEATLGLGLALTMHGYDRMARGAFGDARSDFVESLLIDDTNIEARKGVMLLGGPRGTGVDAMASILHAEASAADAQLYSIHVPVRVDEHLALRFAARQLSGAVFRDSTTGFVAQTQLYVGLERDIASSTVNVMTFLVTGSGPTNLGAAASVRTGGTFGVQGLLAAVGLTGGVNVQFAPTVFFRPVPNVVVAAGARVAHDSAGTVASPIVSVGVRTDRVALGVAAHFGRERWAFNSDGPSLQPYLGTTTRGVIGTLSVRVSGPLAVLAQAQAEQSQRLGAFRTYGVGFRVAVR